MTLRFNIERCTPSEVAGWIDDDGSVPSIDLELDGNWVCSVSPSIYRPDLVAAGYGDGKRGFAVSLIQYFGAAPSEAKRIALKYNGTAFYEGLLGNLTAEDLSARLSHVERQIADFAAAMRSERYRIEAALFVAEGLTHLREEFLRARATAEYQAVFDKGNPLVSVCVTTMNRGDLLVERALGSLLAQTYHDLQVIVVGDHCTDDTAQQIGRLGDQRIRFVNLPKRGPYPREGVDRWRVAGTVPGNRALELVEGDFVTHLDEDDTFEPQRIEILLEKIRKARADLVFHPFWWQTPDGSWMKRGNGNFELGQTSTSTIFYHHYLAQIPWDVFAYRFGEPEDWNRLRKFKMMRVRTEFVPTLLAHLYRFPERDPFVAEPGEEFLE